MALETRDGIAAALTDSLYPEKHKSSPMRACVFYWFYSAADSMHVFLC